MLTSLLEKVIMPKRRDDLVRVRVASLFGSNTHGCMYFVAKLFAIKIYIGFQGSTYSDDVNIRCDNTILILIRHGDSEHHIVIIVVLHRITIGCFETVVEVILASMERGDQGL